MEALWRWTSSAFLLLALNIGCTKSQNVGANCPLPQTLQTETLRDCNLGLANPLLPMNSPFLYPSNGVTQGEACALELQRQSLQDRNIPLALRQQANIPNPCANLVLPNGLNPQNCLPGLLPETLLQNQCPVPPGTPYLPQQNVLESPLLPQGPFLQNGILPGAFPLPGPLIPLNSAPNLGIDIWPAPQGPCPRVDSSPNIVPNLGNHFTTLVPLRPGFSGPCPEGLPLQGIVPSAPGLSPLNQPTPCIPLNNQGVPVDGLNCLPIVPQCDVNLETTSCPASVPQCPPPLNPSNGLRFPQFNMFRLPRPALFQPPVQGPITNTLPNVDTACSPTNMLDQVPVCVNTVQFQQEPICDYPQAPVYFEPNVMAGVLPNLPLFPAQPPAIFQPPLSSNPCTFTTECPDFIPSPLSQPYPPNGFSILPQVTNSANFLPPISNYFTSCNSGLPPVLPNAFIGSNIDNSRLCQPGVTEVSPTPINLQINVPPPVIPAPRITIINATPAPEAPVSTAAKPSDSFDFPYPMPPVIIEGGRSSSRSWLPLFLVALFAGDDFGGCGDGCNSDPIPVPYPIAIPTNNPVIV